VNWREALFGRQILEVALIFLVTLLLQRGEQERDAVVHRVRAAGGVRLIRAAFALACGQRRTSAEQEHPK